jgi:hypothetical protein
MSTIIHSTVQQTETTQPKPTIHIEDPACSIHELLIQLLKAVDVTFGSAPIDLLTQTLAINAELALVVSSELHLERSGYFKLTLGNLAHEQFLQSLALKEVAKVQIRTD